MNKKLKNIKSNLKKVDAHSIKKSEYDELPELTDEMFKRAVYKVVDIPAKDIMQFTHESRKG